jgi:hypothetical protein
MFEAMFCCMRPSVKDDHAPAVPLDDSARKLKPSLKDKSAKDNTKAKTAAILV